MQVVTEFPQRIRCIENLWIPMPDGIRLDRGAALVHR